MREMSERVGKIIDNARKVVYDEKYCEVAITHMVIGYLGAQVADLEALLREVTDESPIVASEGGARCVFCGAVYDNPHTEDCWISRVEKALTGKE
jgi:hypothetical protein